MLSRKKIVLIFTDLLNGKLEGTLEVIKSNPIVLQISNGLTERKWFSKDHLINHPPQPEVWSRSAGTQSFKFPIMVFLLTRIPSHFEHT